MTSHVGIIAMMVCGHKQLASLMAVSKLHHSKTWSATTTTQHCRSTAGQMLHTYGQHKATRDIHWTFMRNGVLILDRMLAHAHVSQYVHFTHWGAQSTACSSSPCLPSCLPLTHTTHVEGSTSSCS